MNRRRYMAILGIALSAGVRTAAAEEPTRPLSLRVSRPTLTLDVEDNRQRTEPTDDGPATSETTTDWTPAVLMRADGAVYHPKFLEFSVATENGLTRGKRRVDNGDDPTLTDNRDFTVGRYDASATLLRDKPVSATAFGNKQRERRDYDQFNRFTSDTESYGGSVRGWGPLWTWDARATHTDSSSDNTDRPSTYREDLLTANGVMERNAQGRTTARVTQQDYRRDYNGAYADSGVQRTLFIWDTTNLGTNDGTRLLSTVNATDLSESPHDNRSLTLQEDYRREHRDNLWSGTTYQFDQRDTPDAGYQQHDAEVYVEHRLYENLDSRLDLRGQYGDGENEYESRYGPGVSETYTRRLGDVGRVGADLGYRIEHINRHASSVSSTVVGEAVRLDDQNPSFLALPNVQTSTIVVRDERGARRYLADIDYRAISRGAFTQLQRVFGGAIPAGSIVLVDYVADSGGSDVLTRAERRYGAELDLYERRMVLYAQQRETDSLSGESLIFEDYRDDVFGAKTCWTWCELGAEHVRHVADSLSYDGMSYYVDVYWNGDATSARLHNGYATLDYRTQEGGLDTWTHTATVDWRPLRALTVQGFAGQYREDTHTAEREMVTLEGRLLFQMAQLLIDSTYRFEDETLDEERRERRYLLVRITREL